MIRLTEFKMSARPYAINLGSRRPASTGVTFNAVWYRRKARVTHACAGRLDVWRLPMPAVLPDDPAELLAQEWDGRYGGHCVARWDGSNLWAPQIPYERAQEYLAVLRPMLDRFPACPPGYDGWWTFNG